jgi:NADH-quinone oxidoreductase subunit F
LPFIHDLLSRLEAGEGREEDIQRLKQLCGHMNRSYCAFAPGAVLPVQGLLTSFEDELREHISQKKCPWGGT